MTIYARKQSPETAVNGAMDELATRTDICAIAVVCCRAGIAYQIQVKAIGVEADFVAIPENLKGG